MENGWINADEARDYKKISEKAKSDRDIKCFIDLVQGRIKEAAVCNERLIKIETSQYPEGEKWETIIKKCIEMLKELGFKVETEAQTNSNIKFSISKIYVRW